MIPQTYVIEKNVPLPVKIRNTIYPYKQMEIGDSFFIEFKKDENKYKQKQRIYLSIWRFCQNKDKKVEFTTISEEKGMRIWRIK